MKTSEENDPHPIITPAFVQRISERLAMGMPLRIALAGEGVKCAEYKEHLREHPDLQELQYIAKRNFLQNAYNILFDGENAAPNFRWLIELIYRPAGSENDDPAKLNLGLTEEEVRRLREDAAKL